MAQRLTAGLARALARHPLRRALNCEAPKPEPFDWATNFKTALVFGATFTGMATVPWAVGYLVERRRLQQQQQPEQHVHTHVHQDAEADPEVLTWLACLKTKPAELSTCQAEWKAVLQRPRPD